MQIYKVVLILISVYLHLAIQTPQIFEDTQICDLDFKERKFKVSKKVLKAENRKHIVYFSLCGPLPKDVGCENGTLMCLVQKKFLNMKTSYISVANDFRKVKDKKGDENFILQSVGGAKCEDTVYNVTITFQPSSTEISKLQISEECDISVNIRRPDYEPKCTSIVDNRLIDLRPLKDKIFEVKSDNTSYLFTLCGENERCGSGISACKISDGSTDVLGTWEKQHVKFNYKSSRLEVVSSLKISKRRKTLFEVILNCDWSAESSNILFKKKLTQGDRYTVTMGSSFACIKFSPDCVIKHESYVYNLHSLYKPSGFYEISTKNNMKMWLNICGPLRLPKRLGQNTCSDSFSQVCERRGNVFTNRGSIMTSKEVLDGFSIGLTFEDGDICNGTERYRTKIEFKCSFVHKNPVYVNTKDCIVNLLWETTKACPNYESESDQCYIGDQFGRRNMDALYNKVKDMSFQITKSSLIKYNICGPLHTECSGYNNVSACLINNGKEFALGFVNKKLLSKNGALYLINDGQICSHGKIARIVFNFICSYENGSMPTLKVLEDSCVYNVTVPTQSACFSTKSILCNVTLNGAYYDFRPLLKTKDNYIITDKHDKNIKYIINICQPVISGSNSLCPGNTMVCLRNDSQPLITTRYRSMATIKAFDVDKDGKIFLRGNGGYCRNTEEYESVIYFECSPRQESLELWKKDSCKVEFKWRTKHACARSTNCTLQSNKLIDLNILKSILMEMHNITYEFDECQEFVNVCKKETCRRELLQKKMYKNDENVIKYLELQVGEDRICNSSNLLHTVLIQFECDNEVFLKLGRFENCTQKVTYKTNLVCPDAKQETAVPSNKTEKHELFLKNTHSYFDPPLSKHGLGEKHEDSLKNSHSFSTISSKKNVSNDKHLVLENKHSLPAGPADKLDLEFRLNDTQNNLVLNNNKCTIRSENRNYFFNVSEIKSEKNLTTEINNYVVNFNHSKSTCHGYVCKNQEVMLSLTDECPDVEYNSALSYVALKYLTKRKCLSGSENYYVEVHLKCNTTLKMLSVNKEDLCDLTLEYSTPNACNLLESNSSLTAVLGTTFGIVLVIFGLIGLTIYSKKTFFTQCSRGNYTSLSNRCPDMVTYKICQD